MFEDLSGEQCSGAIASLLCEGSEHEQESLGHVCASVLLDFQLKGLEMHHPEMQD